MKGVKLEKVMRDLEGFDHEVQMYIYHKINGRDDEAQSYLNAYITDVNSVICELKPVTNEAFEYPTDSKQLKITIPEECEEMEEINRVDERQGAIAITQSQPIKFNLYDFFE